MVLEGSAIWVAKAIRLQGWYRPSENGLRFSDNWPFASQRYRDKGRYEIMGNYMHKVGSLTWSDDTDNNCLGMIPFVFDDSFWVLAPLPIGFAVFMVHLATIPINGTGINLARSFGAAVIDNKEKAWDDQWIFWVGPFIGAAIAAFYHQMESQFSWFLQK